MKRAMRYSAALAVAAGLALAAGCSVNTKLVYVPNPPAADAPKLPAKVAVLPFEDGTENFTYRGGLFGKGQYNLGKAGVAGGMGALPPEFWGKSFADELAASGTFRSSRFVYGRSEVREEDYLVEGTLKKADFASSWEFPNAILASFRATRMSDGKRVWEKESGASWESPDVSTACAVSMKCSIGKAHEDWNRRMNAVLAEARKDFVAALAALAEGGPGGSAGPKAAEQPAGEPVDRTIENILKGK